MVWWLYLRFIVPVLALYYGTALVADEVEDKTITYLFTRPIRRGAVLLGKFLAYFVCTVMVVLPSLMIVYFLMGLSGATLAGTFPSLLKDLGLIMLGLLAYGGLFAWVGAQFKRPLVIGLVFVFGFEQVALIIPGYIRHLTVSYYLQSLVPHAVMGEGVISLLQSLVQQKASLATSLVMLIAIGVVFVFLAMRVIARREYVLEQ
jgi:ABC-type transport system involved in multi-copper enzyme maturation permease subunit